MIYAAEATDFDEHAGYYISEVCERSPAGRKTGLDHELRRDAAAATDRRR